MSQALWNLVRKFCPDEHQVKISGVADDPLWQLAVVADDPKNKESTLVRILAGTLPPISESEKNAICRVLKGTSKAIHEALTEAQVPHPPSYVIEQIKGRMVWQPTPPEDIAKGAPKGQWVKPSDAPEVAEPVAGQEALDNIVDFPKAP